MSNILLLHIGKPKTGTTALQFFLYENEKNLEERGWCYPELKKELPGIHSHPVKEINGTIFYPFRKRDKEMNLTDESWRKENWERIWKCILHHLEKRNVIISAEGLWFYAEEFLADAKKMYENIKVIVYLRRQDRAIESYWNQSIKTGPYCSKTFQEFINCDEEETGGCHYLAKLDDISRIIGKENLLVRAYERQQLCGKEHTIASDFLSVIGIKPDWNKWKDCGIQNQRLDGNFLEIKRIFNSIKNIEIIDHYQYTDIFMKLSQGFGEEETDSGYFTHEERINFLNQFTSENKQIAQEYLHREDGMLFYDDRTDYPLCHAHKCNDFEKDLIRTFTAMIDMQNKRMRLVEQELEGLRIKNQRLKRSNWFLAEKILLQNRKERKILFFGAGQRCQQLLSGLSLPVALIADNDEKKCGRKIKGIEIISAQSINNWFEYFIVITCLKAGEIEEQLKEQGLKREENYVFAKEYFIYD